MKDRMRSRNSRLHARPGRGPFPVNQPTPGYLTAHKRHADLISSPQDRGLRLSDLTALIDLRIEMGVARVARNSFGEAT